MSLDKTEKWASQIINELFEDETNCNFKDDQKISSKTLKTVDHEISISDANESNRYYEAMEVGESNFPLLTFSDLNTNNGISKSLSNVCVDTELSNENNQNMLTSLETSEQDSILKSNVNAKFSEQGFENLPSNASSPMSVDYFVESECLEDLIGDMVNSIETSLDGKHVVVDNVQEIDSLKFYVSDTVSSRSSESKEDSTMEKMEVAEKEENSMMEEFLKEKFDEDSLNLKRIDEKFKALRCKDSDEQGKMGGDEKCTNSPTLKDLYFGDFVENVTKEEMEYRWGRYDPAVRRKYYQNSQKPKAEVGDGLKNETIKKKVKMERQKVVTEVESSDNIQILNEPSLEERSKKRVRFSDPICSEPYRASTTNIYNYKGEQFLERNLVRKSDVSKKKYENDAAEYSNRKNSLTHITDVQQEQNISDDDDDVVYERAVKIISTYREICTTIENFFVKPFAIVIAESIDLIYFVVIMCLCLCCLFYENVVEKALNSSNKFQLPFNNIFRTAKIIITNSQDERNPIRMNSEECVTEELVALEENVFNVTVVENESENEAIDLDVISFVDPTSVLKIRLEFDQANPSFLNFYQKAEDFILSLDRKQLNVAIVSYEHCLVDIIIKEENKLSANEFDMEIIASSKELGYQFLESREINPFKTFKNASGLKKNPDECNETEDQPKATSEDSSFKIKTLVSDQEEYILNSTEVEDSKLIARAASRCSRNCNIVSSSCLDVSFPSKVWCPSKEKLVSSSSLSVNLPSFCSRSDMDPQNNFFSSSSMTEDVWDSTMDSIVGPDSGVQKKLEVENRDKASTNVNLNFGSDTKGKTHVGDKNISFRLKNKKFYKTILPKSFRMETSRQNLNTASTTRPELQLLYPPNIAVDSQENLYAKFDNLESDASESIEVHSNGHTSSEFDTLVEESASAHEKSFQNKSSGKLRRRMSSIFNNWKNIPVMQCMAMNSKHKEKSSINVIKKYKKYFEKP